MKIVRFNPHLALNFEVPRYSEYAGRAYNTFLERGAAKNNLRDSVHVSYEQKSGNHHSIIVIISIGPTREKKNVRKTTTTKNTNRCYGPQTQYTHLGLSIYSTLKNKYA